MAERNLYSNFRRTQQEPQDDEDVFGGGPPTGGGGSQGGEIRPTPLGVPADRMENGQLVPGYRTPRPITTRPAQTADAMASHAQAGHRVGAVLSQKPLYFEGDQLRPASTSPAEIGRLQASLAAAGLLDRFTYGVWDKPSQDAYAALLSESNVAGVTWDAQLRNRASTFEFNGSNGTGSDSRSGSGGGGGHWEFDENGEPVFVPEQYQPPPLQLRTTNKDDLRRVFRSSVIEKMGQGWSQSQIDELVDAYNWQELKVQGDAYQQQVDAERRAFETGSTAGPPLTEVSMASPEAFAEAELRRRDPTGLAVGNAVTDVIPQFASLMRGWGSGG